jgi:hypothetical protein
MLPYHGFCLCLQTELCTHILLAVTMHDEKFVTCDMQDVKFVGGVVILSRFC